MIPSHLQNYLELFARTGEPEIPSLKMIQLLSIPGTDLPGFFNLNVRRQAAARDYLKLWLDNGLDAILMPPAAHTTVPHDTWNRATYTGLWNYLDYPAVIIPVDTVCESDVVDDPSNAKYGAEDAKLYSLCMWSPPAGFLEELMLIYYSLLFSIDTGPELYKNAPIAVQLVGYRYADEKLVSTAALVDSIVNGAQ